MMIWCPSCNANAPRETCRVESCPLLRPCRCPACAPDPISSGSHRGPVQCESATDGQDEAAMDQIEGRSL